ncbi:HNH endonuclease, partial [Salmonella enterica]|nr:HNH endonuclease [Salmonella enterica subsp. enterica serovar Meleagridis]
MMTDSHLDRYRMNKSPRIYGSRWDRERLI